MKIASHSLNLIVPFVVACSSASSPASVPLPPSLSIASIGVAGTPSDNTWTSDNPIQLTLGCSGAPLIVAIDPAPVHAMIDGFTLAVPGNCSTAAACGWLVLRIDPGQANEIVIPTWTVPITVDDPVEPGSHTFSIQLHDASDRVLSGSNNAPIGGQATVEFVQPSECPESSNLDAG